MQVNLETRWELFTEVERAKLRRAMHLYADAFPHTCTEVVKMLREMVAYERQVEGK